MSTTQPTPQKTTNPWAKKIASSSASGSGNYIDQHGRYIFGIKEVIDKRELHDAQGNLIQEKGFKGNSITIRLQVIEAAKRLQSDGDPHEVGDVRSAVFNFDDKSNMAAGKFKAMMMAIFDKPEKDMTADFIDECLSLITHPSQPLLGKLSRGETHTFTTKAKTQGIGVNWGHIPQSEDPVEGQKHPSIAEVRARLLGG